MSRGSRNELIFSRRQVGKIIAGLGIGSVAQPLISGTSAFAQSYPSEQITIVIGYAPGGTSDVMARIIAQYLFAPSGKVVVDNRPGASGNIAAQFAANSAPNGYTLLLGHTTEMTINKYLAGSSNFDPIAKLEPIAMLYTTPHAIAVATASPFSTLKDMVAFAKANPGKIKYASSGIGTPSHLAGEALARGANVKMIHVPYKGAGQAIADVVGGHVDCYVVALPGSIPLYESKQTRYLAVTSPKRVERLPDVPTVTEATGITPYDFPIWGGLFLPTGTPPEVVKVLHNEVNRIMTTAEMREKMVGQHFEILDLAGENAKQFIRAESDKYGTIIKEIGL